MLATTTATTTTTTVLLSTLPMSQSLNQEPKSTTTSSMKSINLSEATMHPFTPGQCLFCPKPSASFTDSVIHMQKSHGLFVPHQQQLAVDLETFFKYLHLVIFEYRECIQCGTERATVQAVQQHMTGKGHCKFDISEQDSEFAEFYNFSELEDDAESVVESEGYRISQDTTTSSHRKPLPVDEDSIRLPSGKIITRQLPAQAKPSFSPLRRRTRVLTSQPKDSLVETEDKRRSSKENLSSDIREPRLLSKREKREKAIATYQLASMSAKDRNALMHLPAAQQRSMLATQHRHEETMQKEERRRQSKIDRKGNKNLYAYWATETPVYLCG